MLNRLFMVIHWILFLWTSCYPTVIVFDLFHYANDTQKYIFSIGHKDFLGTGLILFFVYVVVLWVIKNRWIWFPWQHDKD